MPPNNRSAGRDVHIFDIRDRNTSIGGLVLTAGVTNSNLCTMIEIFVIFNGEYILRNESDIAIKKDNSILLPGKYYIDSPCKSIFDIFLTNLLIGLIKINNETILTRMISQQTRTRI